MWREQALEIGGHRIGPGEPLFVMAEIGLNHGGDAARAIAMVDAAADAGASAVKVQVMVADALVSAACPAPAHVAAESLTDFFRIFELDDSTYAAIAARARARGLAFVATPLSMAAVDRLEQIGVDALKIASGDLTWDGLIERCAATGRPLIMSTGMSWTDEVAHAVACAMLGGTRDIALLHCVSAYPVPRGSENLRAIAALSSTFRLPVGLSDHAEDAFAVPIAVALGASLYERHLVLDRGDGSVDAAVSSTPAELAAIVRDAARAALALGTAEKTCQAAEAVNLRASRRALYARRALPAGAVVTPDDVVELRPAHGLPAGRRRELIGRRLSRDVDAGAPFLERDLFIESSPQVHRHVA